MALAPLLGFHTGQGLREGYVCSVRLYYTDLPLAEALTPDEYACTEKRCFGHDCIGPSINHSCYTWVSVEKWEHGGTRPGVGLGIFLCRSCCCSCCDFMTFVQICSAGPTVLQVMVVIDVCAFVAIFAVATQQPLVVCTPPAALISSWVSVGAYGG